MNSINIINYLQAIFLFISAYAYIKTWTRLRLKYNKKHSSLNSVWLHLVPMGLAVGIFVKVARPGIGEFFYNLGVTLTYCSIGILMIWVKKFHKKMVKN